MCDCISDINGMRAIFRLPRLHLTDCRLILGIRRGFCVFLISTVVKFIYLYIRWWPACVFFVMKYFNLEYELQYELAQPLFISQLHVTKVVWTLAYLAWNSNHFILKSCMAPTLKVPVITDKNIHQLSPVRCWFWTILSDWYLLPTDILFQEGGPGGHLESKHLVEWRWATATTTCEV